MSTMCYLWKQAFTDADTVFIEQQINFLYLFVSPHNLMSFLKHWDLIQWKLKKKTCTSLNFMAFALFAVIIRKSGLGLQMSIQAW